MIIFPAIDIKDGNCVRLVKGDYSTAHKVAEDPLATARSFEAAGAEWIHMVDLDGAKDAALVNKDIFVSVARETGLKVEVGGGVGRAVPEISVIAEIPEQEPDHQRVEQNVCEHAPKGGGQPPGVVSAQIGAEVFQREALGVRGHNPYGQNGDPDENDIPKQMLLFSGPCGDSFVLHGLLL